MNGLYPIIRRKRRPLLPADEVEGPLPMVEPALPQAELVAVVAPVVAEPVVAATAPEAPLVLPEQASSDSVTPSQTEMAVVSPVVEVVETPFPIKPRKKSKTVEPTQ